MKLCLTKWVSFEIKLYLCTAFLAREGEEINNFFVSLFKKYKMGKISEDRTDTVR